MKVERIHHYKELFISHVQQHGLEDHLYMYEAQSSWQEHFDIEAIDLPTSYHNALQSTISGRLWGGSHNSAKESMLAMLDSSKEYMRSAFIDLFATEKDLSLRCDRFVFYCDEAIRSVTVPKMVDHRHDRTVMSMYLAFQYPEVYTLYEYDSFRKMMVQLESRNIPSDIEIERYHKSMKAIHTLLSKDERWFATLSKALGKYYIKGSLLAMVEFARYVSDTDK